MCKVFPTGQGQQIQRMNVGRRDVATFQRDGCVVQAGVSLLVSLLEISERALGYGMIQLYIGAFSYHAYVFGHHPEALETDATSRAALRPTRRRRDLYSQGAPDTNRRSARRVHLQAQALVAACFVNANSRLKPVAHFFHRQLRAEELGALGC